ncbi:MAG: hypothetical protein GY925_26185 [Actinomycetia bacterium]|nr:hypothetical protein [Actinomycetes bacterium]
MPPPDSYDPEATRRLENDYARAARMLGICPRGDQCWTLDLPHLGIAGLEQHVRANGTIHYTRRCADGLIDHGCGKTGDWIGHDLIRQTCMQAGTTPDALPVITHTERPCEHANCDSRYSELHHTYPQHINQTEAAHYPTVALCRTHHAKWHADIEQRTM